MTSGFQIGLVGGTSLEVEVQYQTPDVSNRVNPPTRCKPEPFSISFQRSNGAMGGHGFPNTVWYYKVMNVDEVNLMLSLLTVGGVLQKSRQVYIRTRKPEDHSAFAYYTTWMHLPDGLHDKRQANGLYFDVEWRFTMLETYTP